MRNAVLRTGRQRLLDVAHARKKIGQLLFLNEISGTGMEVKTVEVAITVVVSPNSVNITSAVGSGSH
jgi:ABC-type branched-subunit amino acid transport system ATPase component